MEAVCVQSHTIQKFGIALELLVPKLCCDWIDIEPQVAVKVTEPFKCVSVCTVSDNK